MTTQEATMTTQEVANRFMELAKENNWNQIQDELYDSDAVSIEPPNGMSAGLANAEGFAAIKKKGRTLMP